mmetsp:Transcript_48499/g.80369  ORF Transcript_48499/g.80369 Transcript_48499/m.80369 type:complete len:289 (+) Transcript_48499:48-914(+)
MADVTTLIFDIDDTLYPVSCGFTEHRLNDVLISYMVERLGFESREEASELRTEYFRKYHSSIKGLAVATKEGRLPKPFDEADCAAYWAEYCQFTKYLKPDPAFVQALGTLQEAGLKFIAFSNSPRQYAINCLQALGVKDFFPDGQVFGVDDLLPLCKPEKAAFEKVLGSVGARPEEAVMFEDSMKNIRACKALGLHTVLINEQLGEQAGSEATLLGDVPLPDDPAVDCAMQRIGQIQKVLPGLWKKRFEPAVTKEAAAEAAGPEAATEATPAEEAATLAPASKRCKTL